VFQKKEARKLLPSNLDRFPSCSLYLSTNIYCLTEYKSGNRRQYRVIQHRQDSYNPKFWNSGAPSHTHITDRWKFRTRGWIFGALPVELHFDRFNMSPLRGQQPQIWRNLEIMGLRCQPPYRSTEIWLASCDSFVNLCLTLPCQISHWSAHRLAHAGEKLQIWPTFQFLWGSFFDEGEIWHAIVNLWCTLPYQILSWSVHQDALRVERNKIWPKFTSAVRHWRCL